MVEISDNSNNSRQSNSVPTSQFNVDLSKETVPSRNNRELKDIWDSPWLFPREVRLITPEDNDPATVRRDENAGHFHDAREAHGDGEDHFYDASENHEGDEFHDARTWHGEHPPGHDGMHGEL